MVLIGKRRTYARKKKFGNTTKKGNTTGRRGRTTRQRKNKVTVYKGNYRESDL